MKTLRRMIVAFLVLSVVVFAALAWFASSRIICPPRRPLQDYHRHIMAQAAEHGMRIEVFNVDGTPCLLCEPLAQPGSAMKGNKLRQQLESEGFALAPWGQVRGTLVLLHGHSGRKEDHLPVAERFCAAGFRCLLPDLPGHGEHPMAFASFGVHEVRLPMVVLRGAAEQFHFAAEPAAMFGISQGGAIALQAAAQTEDQWFAVAELSSFSSLDRVIASESKLLFGPLSSAAYAAVTALVKHRAGYVPAQVKPVDAAARLSMPVLIGHGDADIFVTPDQAKEIYDAVPSGKKQFLSIPGAAHHSVLITDAPVYATVSRFFLRALPNRPLAIQ